MSHITKATLFLLVVVFLNKGLAQCPDGYEGHIEYCYKILPVKVSYAEAQHYCEIVGGKLAVIQDVAENTFIKNYLNRDKAMIQTSQIWIGGTDLLQEGTFVAPVSLDALKYVNWAPGEPDNLHGQHCVALFNSPPNFLWDDATCENLNNPLCKRPKAMDTSGIIG